MVVRATRILVGRCRQVSGRCTDDPQRNCHRYLLSRSATRRCLATDISVPTSSPVSPRPQGSLSTAARSRRSGARHRAAAHYSLDPPAVTLPLLPTQTLCSKVSPRQLWHLQHQPRQRPLDKALVVVTTRRTLSFFSSTPVHKQQQQWRHQKEGHDDNRGECVERSPELLTKSSGGINRAGGVPGEEGPAGRADSRTSDEFEGKTNYSTIEKESDRIWTVPNMITMGRIAFCPFLAVLIVTSQHELALAGLLVASLTDWLDGYIARKWDQKSVLGGFLDPLADKVMVTTVALAMGQEGIIPGALVAIMVGRDALLIAGSLAYRYKTRRAGDAFFDLDSLDYKVTPSTLSKVNTFLQFGTLWLGLTNVVYFFPGDAAFSGLCFATGAATLASGVNYLLVSGLKPRGRLGKRLMIQRENLQERYREREVLVRQRMGVGRERMQRRKNELNDRLRARRHRVAGALKNRINRRTRGARGIVVKGEGLKKGG